MRSGCWLPRNSRTGRPLLIKRLPSLTVLTALPREHYRFLQQRSSRVTDCLIGALAYRALLGLSRPRSNFHR